VLQKEKGTYDRRDAIKIKLERESQAAIALEAVHESIPAGSRILGTTP